ncbi:hypothetical protein MTO96_006339 [Rhipicephalus appendiculatus]
MDSPSAGAKSPKPKKSKQKKAKHKDRDKGAQKGADGGVSPAAEQALLGGQLTPVSESPSPAYYQTQGAEPQHAARQQHGVKVGSDQLVGNEREQLGDVSRGPSSNVPGKSDVSSGERKSAQLQEGGSKPSKHPEKARRSKRSKKPGRSSEHGSNAARETKDEAPTAPTTRDQNTPEGKGAPVGTVDECHDSNVLHPLHVHPSQQQQEGAKVVKGGRHIGRCGGKPQPTTKCWDRYELPGPRPSTAKRPGRA